MSTILLLSILIELIITVIGVLIALEKKKFYGWCIGFFFGFQLVTKLSEHLLIDLPKDLLQIINFISSILILIGIWQIYNLKSNKTKR